MDPFWAHHPNLSSASLLQSRAAKDGAFWGQNPRFTTGAEPHDDFAYSSGSNNTPLAPEDALYHASLFNGAYEEHAASAPLIDDALPHHEGIHNEVDNFAWMPFNEDPLSSNLSSTWLSTDNDLDLPSLPGDSYGQPDAQTLSDETYGQLDVLTTVSSYTIFPTEGPSTISTTGFGVAYPSTSLDSIEDGPDHQTTAAPPQQSSSATTNTSRFPCIHPGCFKTYSRHPDMRRHAASHSSAAGFFCHHAGCRRAVRGFLRKDKLLAHLKAVHGG